MKLVRYGAAGRAIAHELHEVSFPGEIQDAAAIRHRSCVGAAVGTSSR